jgi:NADH-quinone oxidoreductase subunit F
MSTLKYFRDEYEEHVVNGRCRAGVCKALTEFEINREKCTGCGLCKKECPAWAIDGDVRQPHIIDPGKCVKCGNCIDVCKFNAVRVR